MNDWFSNAAQWTAEQCGRAYAFVFAVLVVVVWGATGPIFNYSDTWQLLINTGTTVVTFWLVFLIQHTQNKDTLAIQVKLDEIIHATADASNLVMRVEDLTEDQLRALRDRLERRA